MRNALFVERKEREFASSALSLGVLQHTAPIYALFARGRARNWPSEPLDRLLAAAAQPQQVALRAHCARPTSLCLCLCLCAILCELTAPSRKELRRPPFALARSINRLRRAHPVNGEQVWQWRASRALDKTERPVCPLEGVVLAQTRRRLRVCAVCVRAPLNRYKLGWAANGQSGACRLSLAKLVGVVVAVVVRVAANNNNNNPNRSEGGAQKRCY